MSILATITRERLAQSVGRMVAEVRSGAASAAMAPDDSALSYADGWSAAATLAGLVAAEIVADLLDPGRELARATGQVDGL